MSKNVLGHIDCPVCKTVKGMRITHDKNAEPFGFCEASCGQQLRIGGKKDRVNQFVKHHPWAAGAPVTGTGPAPASAPVTGTGTAAPAPAASEKKKTGWFQPILN